MGHVGKAEGNHNHTQRAQYLRCDDPNTSSSPNSQYGDRNEIAEVAFMAGLVDDTKVRVDDSGGGPDDGEILGTGSQGARWPAYEKIDDMKLSLAADPMSLDRKSGRRTPWLLVGLGQ